MRQSGAHLVVHETVLLDNTIDVTSSHTVTNLHTRHSTARSAQHSMLTSTALYSKQPARPGVISSHSAVHNQQLLHQHSQNGVAPATAAPYVTHMSCQPACNPDSSGPTL
jgi:hypothetical protein